MKSKEENEIQLKNKFLVMEIRIGFYNIQVDGSIFQVPCGALPLLHSVISCLLASCATDVDFFCLCSVKKQHQQ